MGRGGWEEKRRKEEGGGRHLASRHHGIMTGEGMDINALFFAGLL